MGKGKNQAQTIKTNPTLDANFSFNFACSLKPPADRDDFWINCLDNYFAGICTGFTWGM